MLTFGVCVGGGGGGGAEGGGRLSFHKIPKTKHKFSVLFSFGYDIWETHGEKWARNNNIIEDGRLKSQNIIADGR